MAKTVAMTSCTLLALIMFASFNCSTTTIARFRSSSGPSPFRFAASSSSPRHKLQKNRHEFQPAIIVRPAGRMHDQPRTQDASQRIRERGRHPCQDQFHALHERGILGCVFLSCNIRSGQLLLHTSRQFFYLFLIDEVAVGSYRIRYNVRIVL